MTTYQKDQPQEVGLPNPMSMQSHAGHGGENACEPSEAAKALDAFNTPGIGALLAALLRPHLAVAQTSTNAKSGVSETILEPLDTVTATDAVDASGTSATRVAMLRTVAQKQLPALPGAIDPVQRASHVHACEPSAPVPDNSNVSRMSALQAALLRPYLTTEETAELLRVQPQTLRRAWSQRGAYGSLKPHKVKGIRRLYWPTDAVLRMIAGEAA
jgi:hypothetical protein